MNDQSLHEKILDTPTEWPDGWVEQAHFRNVNDLPPFHPPRFSDGADVRTVRRQLMETYGVDIRFFHDGEWHVRIDGRRAFAVARERDDSANTVVKCSRDRFIDRVSQFISEA